MTVELQTAAGPGVLTAHFTRMRRRADDDRILADVRGEALDRTAVACRTGEGRVATALVTLLDANPRRTGGALGGTRRAARPVVVVLARRRMVSRSGSSACARASGAPAGGPPGGRAAARDASLATAAATGEGLALTARTTGAVVERQPVEAHERLARQRHEREAHPGQARITHRQPPRCYTSRTHNRWPCSRAEDHRCA